MRKQGDGYVIRSEESITLMTSYRFPHHEYRSFTFVQDDVLPLVTFLSANKKGPPVAAGENAFLFHRTILCLSFSMQRGMYGTMEKIPFIS
jgi:hypothetical protein